MGLPMVVLDYFADCCFLAGCSGSMVGLLLVARVVLSVSTAG